MRALLKFCFLKPVLGVLLATSANSPLLAEEIEETAVDRFFAICGGGNMKANERLPGSTVRNVEAPVFFQRDLKRADGNSRVTRINDEYSMRAIMSSAAGMGGIIAKCALGTNQTGYDDALTLLELAAGEKSTPVGRSDGPRRAMFASIEAPFQIFEEADGWISLYRMDVFISADGIDPKYLKEGAKPATLPRAK